MQPSDLWIIQIGITIAAVSAVIAAVSSLANGRRLKNGSAIVGAVVRKALHKGTKKKTSNGGSKDWFEPPDLS